MTWTTTNEALNEAERATEASLHLQAEIASSEDKCPRGHLLVVRVAIDCAGSSAHHVQYARHAVRMSSGLGKSARAERWTHGACKDPSASLAKGSLFTEHSPNNQCLPIFGSFENSAMFFPFSPENFGC